MSSSLLIVLHVVGAVLLFLGLGGMMVRAGIDPEASACRRYIAITHGSGLLLLLAAGIALFSRLGTSVHGWLMAKFIMWLLLGLAPALLKRKPHLAGVAWWVALVLGAAAAFLGVYKPF